MRGTQDTWANHLVTKAVRYKYMGLCLPDATDKLEIDSGGRIARKSYVPAKLIFEEAEAAWNDFVLYTRGRHEMDWETIRLLVSPNSEWLIVAHIL